MDAVEKIGCRKKNISAGVFIRAIIHECNPCFIWIWKPWIVQDKVNRNLRIYFLSLLLLTKTWHLYYFKVVYCFITILFKFFWIFCSGLVSSHCTFNLKDKRKKWSDCPFKGKVTSTSSWKVCICSRCRNLAFLFIKKCFFQQQNVFKKFNMQKIRMLYNHTCLGWSVHVRAMPNIRR